ncbi:xanthine dehydrogenase accessory protein XdhC [soil metagenome]
MKPWALIKAALETHGTCAMISVLEAKGSAPRDAGSRIILTPEGFHGTIGGGALEWQALAAAQVLLGKRPAVRRTNHQLGPQLGQCCGGRVELLTEIYDVSALPEVSQWAEFESQGCFMTENRIGASRVERSLPRGLPDPAAYLEPFGEDPRPLYLFGAGHVGRALILALAPLPFRTTWIDMRPNAFPGALPDNAAAIMSADPPAELTAAPAGSFVLVMSHSHALDLAIVEKAMRRDDLPYVGLIGSATKRARFVKRLAEAGLPAARIAGLVCPIGAGLASKLPTVIAAATAVEVLKRDEMLRAETNPAAEQAPASRESRA